jgi:anti-anti-sigma factor
MDERLKKMIICEELLHSWFIITLQGKFIIRNLTMIRKHFDKAEKISIPDVAIDMEGVTQIDSSAITILVNFQRRIIQRDGRLVLFGLRSDIAEIFSIVGIEKMFRMCKSKDGFVEAYVKHGS